MAKPEDADDLASSPPRELERNLVVQQIPKEDLSLAAAGMFDISGALAYYKSDWRIVSHNFTLQEDGSALLTCILERERTRWDL